MPYLLCEKMRNVAHAPNNMSEVVVLTNLFTSEELAGPVSSSGLILIDDCCCQQQQQRQDQEQQQR